MTIREIWKIASQYSRAVPIQQLSQKTVAIDGHIWLFEIPTANYLSTFFKRCYRLMEYNIRLIVVFDSPQMYGEVEEMRILKLKDLLNSIGVHVIIAPNYGEAQCAQLEANGITSGCITTDFEYFLFGGRNIYTIEFTEDVIINSMVTCMDVLENKLTIYRNGLIVLAILLGCDYLENCVNNVSLGFDIVQEFTMMGDKEEHPLVILDRFASYVRNEIPQRSQDSERKLKLARNCSLPSEFPNTDHIINTIHVYLCSNVIEFKENEFKDNSRLKFKQAKEILVNECGWTTKKALKELRARKLRIINRKREKSFAIKYKPVVEECKLKDYLKQKKGQQRKSRGSLDTTIQID